ncbi:cupin domain-containing protein [Salibacteraceae bacterium]|jgi:quercetin dioxygenase-like cupin family protein|nr:cupin domain-containing protein [Salibacteraceae bacterium]
MTRKILSSIFVLLLSGTLAAQQITNIANFQPELNYENIHVYELDSDPLTSTFIIWVKDEVAEHHHAEHTEIVYVLEGTGEMTLGDKKQKIKSGDYIFIPKGTKHSVKVQSKSPMKVLSVQTPRFDGSDRVLSTED